MRRSLITVVIVAALLLPLTSSAQEDYSGTLRLFVVEPTSRWHDSFLADYEYGFLDFAAVRQVDVKELDAWQTTVQWNANQAGFEGVTEDNIAVIAVLYADTSVVSDAFPPYGYFYDAYYVDRATLAVPGGFGIDNPTGGFSHTVFIEQGATSG